MYGSESEVFVHTFTKTGKTQNLIAEKEGRNTIDNPLRFKLPQNYWVVVAAEDLGDQHHRHELVAVAHPQMNRTKLRDILDTLSRNLRSQGQYGLANIKNIFRELDLNCSSALFT